MSSHAFRSCFFRACTLDARSLKRLHRVRPNISRLVTIFAFGRPFRSVDSLGISAHLVLDDNRGFRIGRR